MTEKHLKFLDYILPLLSEDGGMTSLSSLAHIYKKETGIEFNYKELDHFLELYDYEYFVKHDKIDYIKIDPEYKEIIDEHGSLSKYRTLEKEQELALINEQNELILLQKEHLSLQNENLKYQETIREQEARIRTLTEHKTIIDVFKAYWWLLGAGIIIGAYIYRIFFT